MRLSIVLVLMILGTVRAGSGETPPQVSDPIAVISHGEKIDLAEWTCPGKVTIFDFYSRDCPPCRKLKPELIEAVSRDPGVCLRVVDIDRPGLRGIDMLSPVARQYSLEFLPHLVVFDREGREMAVGDVAREMISGWLAKGTPLQPN